MYCEIPLKNGKDDKKHSSYSSDSLLTAGANDGLIKEISSPLQ